MANTNNKGHTEEVKEKISFSMLGNKNAEKYDEEEATKLFIEALELSQDDYYDSISLIAKKQKVYRELYRNLSNRFSELKDAYNVLLTNMEANCYSLLKDNKINTAGAIMNLKSNFKWTDRLETDNTNKNTNVNFNIKEVIKFKDDNSK